MLPRITIAVGLLLLVSSSALGQMTGYSSTMGQTGQFSMTASFTPPRFSPPAIIGEPYSADQLSEHTQTLNDGTHIKQPSNGVVRQYRDSAGRTRTERPFFRGPQSPPDAPLLVEITDPIAGCEYFLDTVNRVAHRTVFVPLTGSGRGTAVVSAGPKGIIASPPHAADGAPVYVPQHLSESLGTQVIEGVLVEGRLTRTTYPAGMMGNDRPIDTTGEIWTSPELRVMILSKNSDPRSGESIMRLTNISRAEPDPGLFQVPAEYQIVDETGPFTIKISRP